MNVKPLAIAAVASIATVTPAFAGASVTNQDVHRVTYGMSDVIGTTKINSFKYEDGTSAAIKLETEGSKDVSSTSCGSFSCRTLDTSTSGANIIVSAGDDFNFFNNPNAEVYGSASGTTVIGAASESSFYEKTATNTNILFTDWADYVEVENTHTVSTDAF